MTNDSSGSVVVPENHNTRASLHVHVDLRIRCQPYDSAGDVRSGVVPMSSTKDLRFLSVHCLSFEAPRPMNAFHLIIVGEEKKNTTAFTCLCG